MLRQIARRSFSSASSHADHQATATTWKKRTLIAIPCLAVLCAYNAQLHFAHAAHEHEHDEEHAKFSYQRIMKKKYPWEANECNLFDLECKEKFYAKRAMDAIAKENKIKAAAAAAEKKKVDDKLAAEKAVQDAKLAAEKAAADAKAAAEKQAADAKAAAEQAAADAKAALEAAAEKAKEVAAPVVDAVNTAVEQVKEAATPAE